MPSKEELRDALKVMEAWLAEAAQEALIDAGAYQPGVTTLDSMAYKSGVATGLAQAAQLLRMRVDDQP